MPCVKSISDRFRTEKWKGKLDSKLYRKGFWKAQTIKKIIGEFVYIEILWN